MAPTTGALRQKRVTPIRDFAPRNTIVVPLQSGLTNRPRLHNTLRRSTMFSLALKFVKLCGYLFVMLLVLLLALNFKVVYQGNGQFTVRSKDRWAFSGTFESAAPNTGRPSTVAAAPAPQQRPATSATAPSGRLEQSLSECARIRHALAGAVARHDGAHPRNPMRELDIFSLLSGGYIRELPNCPAGGEYRLHDGRIVCSRHIE